MPLELAHGIPNRTLVNRASPRGHFVGMNLESIRDALRFRRNLQNPQDFARSFSNAHLTFGDGANRRATLRFIDEPGAEYHLTHSALTTIGREVLPPRAMGFLMDQAHDLGDNGRKLSDMTFALHRAAANDRTLRTFRAFSTRDGDHTVRAIRSVHSTDYAAYDNLEFVEDLLAAGYANLPVAAWRESTEGLRLRFLRGEPELHVPVPMFEVWNSETGHRAVTVRQGLFKLVCTNGMHSTENTATNRWAHRGDRERIRLGVRAVMHESDVAASGLLDRYNDALTVAIDDAFAWFSARVEGFNAGEVAAVETALRDITTTPGGMLASVVDAVTLIAQDAGDEYRQEEIEFEGSRLLARGLAEAVRRDSRVLVAAA